jgi:hypothetical protein
MIFIPCSVLKKKKKKKNYQCPFASIGASKTLPPLLSYLSKIQNTNLMLHYGMLWQIKEVCFLIGLERLY